MNITDEAVEAACEAFWKDGEGDSLASMRKALEAAAPILEARVLREASAAYPLETAYGGAEHAVNWLKDRAEYIEAVPTGAASLVQEDQ
jgi:ribosomal protein S7